MQYKTNVQSRIALNVLVYTSIAINAAQEPTIQSNTNNTAAIYADVSTEQQPTSQSVDLPKNPLYAVKKTKEAPADSRIRYEKTRDMELPRLREARLYYLWDNNVDAAIHVIQRILTLEDDQDAAAYHMIELGDLYCINDDYTTAKSIYETFLNLYPGSVYVEAVYRRLFMCHEQLLLDPDKDQTETRNMITRAQTYITTFGQSGTYIQKAYKLREYGYQQLCKSELDTCDFYLNKYTYTEAASSLRAAYYRLKYIYDELAAYLPYTQSQQMVQTLAHAIQHITIESLDETQPEQKEYVYKQLYDIRNKLSNICGEITTWRINPLRRF